MMSFRRYVPVGTDWQGQLCSVRVLSGLSTQRQIKIKKVTGDCKSEQWDQRNRLRIPIGNFSLLIHVHQHNLNPLSTKISDDNVHLQYIKNVLSKLYNVGNSKSRGQTVQIQLRWLIMCFLIWT